MLNAFSLYAKECVNSASPLCFAVAGRQPGHATLLPPRLACQLMAHKRRIERNRAFATAFTTAVERRTASLFLYAFCAISRRSRCPAYPPDNLV